MDASRQITIVTFSRTSEPSQIDLTDLYRVLIKAIQNMVPSRYPGIRITTNVGSDIKYYTTYCDIESSTECRMGPFPMDRSRDRYCLDKPILLERCDVIAKSVIALGSSGVSRESRSEDVGQPFPDFRLS